MVEFVTELRWDTMKSFQSRDFLSLVELNKSWRIFMQFSPFEFQGKGPLTPSMTIDMITIWVSTPILHASVSPLNWNRFWLAVNVILFTI